jgi:plastocyanin
MLLTSISVFLASVAMIKADNYMVTVGQGGFVFNPTTVMADAGDTIEFVVSGVSSLFSSN